MKILLAIVAGIGVALLSTSIAAALQARSSHPLLLFYLPGILIVAYFGGLPAGAAGAAVSTLLASNAFFSPEGLRLAELRAHAVPSLFLLVSGLLIAVAGDRLRRFHLDLREDLRRSRRRARSEAFLARITGLMLSPQEEERLGATLCRECAAFFGDWAAVVLAGAPPDGLHLESFGARDDGQDDAGRRAVEDLLPGDGAAVRSLLDRPHPGMVTRPPSAALGANVAAGPEAWLDRHHVKVLLVVPLRLADEWLGALLVGAYRLQARDAEDLRVAQAAGVRMALTAHRRRLNEQHRYRLDEQRRRREREARLVADIVGEFATRRDLAELLNAIVRRCTEVLGEWCGVQLIDPQSPWMSQVALHHQDPRKVSRLLAALEQAPLARDHPLVQQIFEHPGPLVIAPEDPAVVEQMASLPVLQEAFTQLGVRTVLVIPMCAGGESLGILGVGRESDRRWDEDDMRLAALIADRVGAAIENARLLDAERLAREGAEREARRVVAVNRLIAIAASSLDLRTVFDEFTEALQLLVPFVRVSVSLYSPDDNSLKMPYFKGPKLTVTAERLEGPKAGTVRGWVLDHDRPFVRADTMTTRGFTEDELLASAGIRSYVVVPMRVGGRAIGTLNFGYYKPGFYTDRHAQLIQPIADQLGLTISRFHLFEEVQRRAGELAETLQRALLPADLPKAPFTAMGATYRPADQTAKLGGDWYDAVLLPDERITASVGDITGHGLATSIAMSQIRHVVRAFALEGRSPAEILAGVNRFLYRLPEHPQLSVWVGTLDPYSGDLRYASAGHPPALVLTGDRSEFLPLHDPPLGLSPTAEYAEARVHIPPGSRLILYTDGLIEATRNLDEGESRLLDAAGATSQVPPARAVDFLIDRVLRDLRPHDDIGVLVIDRLPLDAPLSLTVPATPENQQRIRRAMRAFGGRVGVPSERLEEVVVALGEATLNVVDHAYRGKAGSLTIRGERNGDVLTITVSDVGQWRPPQQRADRGLGTRIMEAFADRVRTHTGPTGTVVELTWRLTRAVPARRP